MPVPELMTGDNMILLLYISPFLTITKSKHVQARPAMGARPVETPVVSGQLRASRLPLRARRTA